MMTWACNCTLGLFGSGGGGPPLQEGYICKQIREWLPPPPALPAPPPRG